MSNKKIVILTGIIVFSLFLILLFYIILVRPVIVGEYTPSIKECQKAYDCDCLQDTCICTFKKYFWENRLTCKRDNIKNKQLRK